MTNRVSYAPQDFERMCKQADRDHEARKLQKLLERVKQQIAEREKAGLRLESAKPPVSVSELPIKDASPRPAPFDR